MKVESTRKVVIVCSAVLIGIAICVSVWFFLQEYKVRSLLVGERPSVEHQSAFPTTNKITGDKRNAPQQAQNPDGNQEKKTLAVEERTARRAKSNIMAMYTEEELATPRNQKLLAAMDSPEFHEVLENFSTRNWFDFLDSKGIPTDRAREALDGAFRNNFNGTPEDYEPEMRLKIAKLFVDAGPVDLTDPEAASRQRNKVFNEFSEDRRIFGWYLAQFDEDWDGIFLGEREGVANNPALVWMTDVQKNAATIVADAETASVSAPETQVSVPSWDLSDVVESDSVSFNETKRDPPGISTPLTDALEQSTVSSTEIRAATTPAPSLTDMPSASSSVSTIDGLGTALKSQFSSERLRQAMSTLERHGTEEGLHRLRENDPEVAEQVERYRRGEQKENSK